MVGWLVGEVSLKDSAKMFAQFLIVSNRIVRRHLPQVFLVSGGLMQDGHNPSDYMAEALKYDIAPCFDIFGYHPYGHDDQLLAAQKSIEDSLRRSDLSDKPVWFTEYGTTNNKDRKNRLNSTFKEAKDLNAIFWFLNQDFGVINNTYGLVDFFGKRKPDFFLFKNLVKQHQSVASRSNK